MAGMASNWVVTIISFVCVRKGARTHLPSASRLVLGASPAAERQESTPLFNTSVVLAPCTRDGEGRAVGAHAEREDPCLHVWLERHGAHVAELKAKSPVCHLRRLTSWHLCLVSL